LTENPLSSPPDDPAAESPTPRRSFSETTNLSLIDRVRDRDTESWRQFMSMYRPLVSYWCRRGGLQGYDAEDVCQDVFSSVAKSIVRFQKLNPGDSFRGWLRTITRARVADFVRRTTNTPRSPGGDEAHQFLSQLSEPVRNEETDPGEREAYRDVFRQALEMVRSGVENRTWQAFWRTTVDELNATEVADELGMTSAAVRKAKSRMTIRLRIELGPLLDEITQDAGIDLES
jgi:RNA polymerase sigma-70 factor (ECF subfamily)